VSGRFGYFCPRCGNTAEISVETASEVALAVFCGCADLPDLITAAELPRLASMDSVEVRP